MSICCSHFRTHSPHIIPVLTVWLFTQIIWPNQCETTDISTGDARCFFHYTPDTSVIIWRLYADLLLVFIPVFLLSAVGRVEKKRLENELRVFVFFQCALIRTCITYIWPERRNQMRKCKENTTKTWINKYRKVTGLPQPHKCRWLQQLLSKHVKHHSGSGAGMPSVDSATHSCIFLCVIRRVRQEPSGPSAGLTQPQHLCQTASTNNNSARGYKQGETHCSTIQTISNSKGVTVTLLLLLPV